MTTATVLVATVVVATAAVVNHGARHTTNHRWQVGWVAWMVAVVLVWSVGAGGLGLVVRWAGRTGLGR